MTVIEVKLKHKDFAPDGTWFWIAHKKDEHHIDDSMVYYYANNDVKFKDWKVGDRVELDDWFEIMEISQIVPIKR